MADTEVVELLQSEYFNSDMYGLRCGIYYLRTTGPLNTYSVYTYRKWIEDWGFLSTRKQNHNEETIRPWVENVKQRFPTKGAEGIKIMLSLDHGVKAPRFASHLNYTPWS